nr:B3 domain-containing protein Os01g0234100 isoform X1 [Aegilops tauschii subsp. strangulata]
MAIDEPIKRKRGTPAGDPHSAKSKMRQKMVHPRHALLDERSSRHGDDDDFDPMGKGGTPAGDSPHSARTKMGHKMSLAHRRLSFLDDGSGISRHIAAAAAAADDDGGAFELMFAVDVPQKNTPVDDSDDDFVPLIMMRTKNVKSGRGKHPGFQYKHKARRTITKTYKRNKTENPARSKRHGKRKLEKKPMLVDNNNISKSNKGTDADVEPEIPDDDGRKKYASVFGFYGSALDRALEVENKLPAEGPSFVKLMQKSHVVKGFWLGVPLNFCGEHLPKHDVTIVLEDEDGHGFDTNYLARKQGLSGGWHGFVVRHGLMVGDAVIFQLVGPKRFKVYILRENKFTTTDGPLGLLSLDTSMENNILEETSYEDVKSKKDLELTKVITNKASDNDSNDLFSEEAVNGGIRSAADPDPDFDAVKTFRAFKTVVDSSVIDRKLVPDHQLWRYYKLCGARKAFLHRRLPKHINPTLATGVIAETASIAKGIRSYPTTSSSSFEDLAAWKKTLESFELLGMDVSFMRKRVDELLFLLDASPSDDHPSEGYEEAMKLERARATEKVRALESKMASLKDALKEMDMEMEEIAGEKRGHADAMLQLAAAPW